MSTAAQVETIPSEIAEAFASNPNAHLILVEMGHGFGKAKFPGTCKITGIHISINSTIRHLVFWSRAGRKFDGYVPSKTAGLLAFRSAGGGKPATSSWRKWTPDWLAEIDLSALPVGTTIRVMEDARGSYDCEIKSWSLTDAFGKREWTHKNNRTSDAQLRAAFARRANGVAFQIEAPWRTG